MARDGEWPRREVLRLEGFSDAVFAFAITLLVVSLETPKSFAELSAMLKGAPAFAVCFALFWMIWKEHHRFFQRYGLDDTSVIVLNAMLLFVVLLYVYPLKFLFTLLLHPGGVSNTVIRSDQGRMLMVIYSSGYAAVFGLFALMYRHAYTARAAIGLTPRQSFETKAQGGAMLIHVTFGIVSVLIALALPTEQVGLAGLWYFFVGPAHWFYWSRVARHRARLATSR